MIPFNHHHLYYFWVAAREKSITKACRKLLLAQPTVSAQIRRLEAELGVRLFERGKKALELTEEGRLVLDGANRIFFHSRELLDSLKEGPARLPSVRLGIETGVCRAAACAAASKLASGRGRLRVEEGSLEALLEELDSHALDLVVTRSPPLRRGKAAMAAEVGRLPVSFYASSSFAARGSWPGCARRLPLLLPPSADPLRVDLDRFLAAGGVSPRSILEIGDEELLRRMVLGGAGIGPLDSLCARPGEERGRLRSLGGATGAARVLWLAAEKGRWLDSAAQSLLEKFHLGPGGASRRTLRKAFREMPPAELWPSNKKIVQSLMPPDSR
ncbi:MAG: LysR family transcriptional regulator [Elusimicrobiota bacterium]